MTTEELLAREAISQTISRYTAAGDRLKVDDYVACFTDDGIIETQHKDPASCFRYEGREAIRDWQQRWLDRTKAGDNVHDATFARHHLTTCNIEMTGADTAKAVTYWVAWTDIGADHAGHYLDDFRKVGDAWLIAHRRVREDWRSADSLFQNAVEKSR